MNRCLQRPLDGAHPAICSRRSIEAAVALLNFHPSALTFTASCYLESIAVFVMDHRGREVRVAERTVELHYGRFVRSQRHPGHEEATRLARSMSPPAVVRSSCN